MQKIMFFSLIYILAIVQSSQALVLTSPQHGATFKEDDSIKLVAELSPGQTELIESVRFIVSELADVCPNKIQTHPRYECSFILPPGSPRTISIMAYAVTSIGPIYSQEVNINVALPSAITLQALKSMMGNRYYFSRLTQKRQIYIQGIYSDGVERDLEKGETGTTYTSSNEKIVTVNADGLATAIGAGTAQITVRNGDKKLVIDVVVQPKR